MSGKPRRLITRSRERESVEVRQSVDQSAVKRAELKLQQARKTWDETGDSDHWQYMQECIRNLEQLQGK